MLPQNSVSSYLTFSPLSLPTVIFCGTICLLLRTAFLLGSMVLCVVPTFLSGFHRSDRTSNRVQNYIIYLYLIFFCLIFYIHLTNFKSCGYGISSLLGRTLIAISTIPGTLIASFIVYSTVLPIL